ncbi:hypothetical protein PHJA_002892000 [Phtheirospermum japonicum]|uniref:Uncharacterized protein n=1 Tax=Phtheirospermum japonicum TaxID=374723 RepID=A0A830DCP2_9LAMI|nr:hypothetical protein PHJA_002892000 [Phtheirospermum japonicum]
MSSSSASRIFAARELSTINPANECSSGGCRRRLVTLTGLHPPEEPTSQRRILRRLVGPQPPPRAFPDGIRELSTINPANECISGGCRRRLVTLTGFHPPEEPTSLAEIHYVDVGLNAEGAYITDKDVIGRVCEQIARRDFGIRFVFHGTPRQWCDERRVWIRKEKDGLVGLLKGGARRNNMMGKLQFRERLYFPHRLADMQMHFEIIDFMDDMKNPDSEMNIQSSERKAEAGTYGELPAPDAKKKTTFDSKPSNDGLLLEGDEYLKRRNEILDTEISDDELSGAENDEDDELLELTYCTKSGGDCMGLDDALAKHFPRGTKEYAERFHRIKKVQVGFEKRNYVHGFCPDNYYAKVCVTRQGYVTVACFTRREF